MERGGGGERGIERERGERETEHREIRGIHRERGIERERERWREGEGGRERDRERERGGDRERERRIHVIMYKRRAQSRLTLKQRADTFVHQSDDTVAS